MASYKYKEHLAHNDSVEFDTEHKPGQAAPFSGIYRYRGAGGKLPQTGENRCRPKLTTLTPAMTVLSVGS
jgi:hypothetical protein